MIFSSTNRFLFIALLGVAHLGTPPFVRGENVSALPLFDEWAKGENGGGQMREFGRWGSPSGQYALSYLKSDRDLDTFILVGKSVGDGETITLGRGMFGVDATWVQTSVGEMVIVDHRISGGLNELFVIKPSDGSNWSLLYRTPTVLTPSGLVMDRCYWSVLGMDVDTGSLRLRAAWDFSNMTNAARRAALSEGIYEIPLFYGLRKVEKAGPNRIKRK